MTVTDVTDDQVTITTAPEAGGTSRQRVEARTKTLELAGMDRAAPDRQETVKVNGVEFHCTVVTVKNRRGESEERWYTNEIPVTGLLKRKVRDKIVSEVVEWGTEPKKS